MIAPPVPDRRAYTVPIARDILDKLWHGKPVAHADYLAAMAHRGVDATLADDALDVLLTQGDWYEPKLAFFSKVGA